MDEKGFLKGRAAGVKVLVERREDGTKGDAGVVQGMPYILYCMIYSCWPILLDGARELITVIDGSDASGNTWVPAIINKGVYTQRYVAQAVVETFGELAYYAVSASGWTDDVLGREWIEHVYDKQSRFQYMFTT